MLSIVRDGNDGEVRVEAFVPTLGTRIFRLRFSTGSDWSAGLVAGNLSEAISSAVKAARSEAYANGWRDAKAKRKKCEWFSESL